MKKESEILRYDKMVEAALRGVVRKSLQEIIEYQRTKGAATQTAMPGEHHFYITFMTDYPGVKIPEYLRDRYPGEMTIVLQYQFKQLKVDDDILQVELSFNNTPELLKVPLAAISIFADPSVNFILHFQPMGEDAADADLAALDELDEDGPDDGGPGKGPSGGGKGSGKKTKKTGEVVSLDKFRKK